MTRTKGVVCDFAVQDYAFLRNLAYTFVDAENCGSLAIGSQLFQMGTGLVITDSTGLAQEKLLAVIDVEDAATWLGVVLVIESLVLLQERGMSEGPLITTCRLLNIAFYNVRIMNAAIWAWMGRYVYAWDELLWNPGFAAIGMNLSAWRDDLDEAAARA